MCKQPYNIQGSRVRICIFRQNIHPCFLFTTKSITPFGIIKTHNRSKYKGTQLQHGSLENSNF